MFNSWKRSPQRQLHDSASPNKKRSMPVPLKDHENAESLKSSSDPVCSETNHSPKPEFSSRGSAMSVQTLQRLVQGLSSDTSSPEQRKSKEATVNKESEAVNNEIKTANNNDNNKPGGADPPKPEDSWIWSIFRSDKRSSNEDRKQVSNGGGGDSSSSGSAWAFWTRDQSNTTESGKLAISGTESEHRPRKAEVKVPAAAIDEDVKPGKRSRTSRPSIVIPTFQTVPTVSRTSRIASLLWSSKAYTNQMTAKSPSRPKRVVIIGVHGYFPARMTRAILGEPTGTSIKFANEAESRLQNWLKTRFPDEDVKVDKIALEGEGRIDHRVDKLYGLLLNWEDLLKQADFIFFAVHSQGAVVTVNMVSRLLRQKLVSSAQQVTILSMAGSLLGPMPGMDKTLVMKAITRIEHDSLIELFELQHTETSLSSALRESLATVLSSGVKLVLVGSADDQLIPLYSALAVNVRHPNIFRAVYIDGDDVMPEVVSPLLQLATQQLNFGHSDHGVITELSGVLAGALTSKGHSKLYNNDGVYDLGLRIALETNATHGITPQFDLDFRINRTLSNPFVLPWAANALISESREDKRLLPIVRELFAQFNSWKPETKQMKDIKLRLAGISRISKL